MKKRMVSLLLILCMLLAVLPTAVLAEENGSNEQETVAKINEMEYNSLTDAVEHASSDSTVVLVKESNENVTIKKKIQLTAMDGVTFRGTLIFANGSADSKVVNMTFDYTGSKKNIITICGGVSGVTVGGCSFTLRSSSADQPNCIYQEADGAKIVDNKFHLTRIADRSVVAINLSGKGTDDTMVSENSFDVLAGGDNDGSLFFFKAMGEVKEVGATADDYITSLRITNNQINGSGAENAAYFAGISGVQDPVITGNRVENCTGGIFHITWTDRDDHKWGAKNDLSDAIISGNTYTNMTNDVLITLAKAARKHDNTWTDYNRVQDAVDAIQPGDKVIGRLTFANGKLVDPPTPTRSGYHFDGWYTKDGTNGDWGEKAEDAPLQNGSKYYYAKWTEDPLAWIPAVVGANQNPFSDVPGKAYYNEAVRWAVKYGIASGTDAKHFSPDAACTRGQAVTFLWRAAGCPAPALAENPFTDVKPADYCYDAVLWAVQTGVAKGTSQTTYSPDAPCTRGQIVTFLYRAAGSPSGYGNSGYTDVPETSYCAAPVAWAVALRVTSGTSALTFSPDALCTRAQIVTFLYRANA